MPPDSTIEYSPADDEPLSSAILSALSKAKGHDITEDEYVLYDSIDTDALDRLFREDSDGDTIRVEFTTHDAIVVIQGDGQIRIEVQDLEASTDRE